MDKKSGLPKRKHPRLKCYDYSQPGFYFVTICVQDRLKILSRVGQGLAPAETVVDLSPLGRLLEQQLFELEKRYDYVRIDKYIIMPDHIHVIIELTGDLIAAAASDRPTLYDIVGAYKSITTRLCNKIYGTPGRKLFQTSFYEAVIRTEQGYFEAYQYIEGNPGRWMERRGNLV